MLDYTSVYLFALDHVSWTPDAIAAELVDGLTNHDLRTFAKGYVRDYVERSRRSAARATERNATTNAPSPLSADDLETAQFEHARSKPGTYIGNCKVRPRFERWMGDDFPNWYASGVEAIMAGSVNRRLEDFEADWAPGGVSAFNTNKLLETLNGIITEHTTKIRLDLTKELLATVFAVGDGTHTTWGDATIEQHEQRITMLTRNAVGNIETAARHDVAVRMIRERGATHLRELAL